MVTRVLTLDTNRQTPSKHTRWPNYDRRAKDNIQEVRFWQEKKSPLKSINQRNLLDKKLSGVSAAPGEACPLVREYIATL